MTLSIRHYDLNYRLVVGDVVLYGGEEVVVKVLDGGFYSGMFVVVLEDRLKVQVVSSEWM